MLDSEDIEQIRKIVTAIVREELEAHTERLRRDRQAMLNAERQRRFRAKHRNAERNASPQGNVTLSNVTRNGAVTLSNAHSEEKRNGAVTLPVTEQRDLFFPNGSNGSISPTPPLTSLPPLPNNSSENTIMRHKGADRVDRTKPKDYEELLAYMLTKGLKERDALWLWAKWMGCNFKNNGKPMARWKAVIAQWDIQGDIFPTHKNNKP